MFHNPDDGITIMTAVVYNVNKGLLLQYITSTLLTTTLMCHDRPLFANQLALDSLYLLGRNFIAQSSVIMMDLSSRSSNMSTLALSYWTDRSW